ncbi:MAG: hypothetical protein M3373_07085 [Gemmatimonadota bacterium]|nr:hypothetical protein [Gemmatimonadota bacterium]
MAKRRTLRTPPAATPAVAETTVFRSGNSDAVRLPKRFAFLGKRVRLRRLRDGRVLIEPVRKRRWPAGFLESFGRMTDDFDAPERPPAVPDADARAAALFDRAE